MRSKHYDKKHPHKKVTHCMGCGKPTLLAYCDGCAPPERHARFEIFGYRDQQDGFFMIVPRVSREEFAG